MVARIILLAACALAGSVNGLAAAEIDPVALQDAFEQGAQQYVKAFNERDAAGLAAMFTPEAEYVDSSGTVFHGRDAIAAEFATVFELVSQGKLELEIISIRPVAAGVVVEDGVATFRLGDGDHTSWARYTATHIQQADGTWLMASVRELESPRISPRDRLTALSWLEGAWREEVGGTGIITQWKKSDDGNFLVSEFSVNDINGISLTGTQRIGWDAERGQFRSWVFDSTGASAEGWWQVQEDGTWSVQMSGVDSEGARTRSVLTYAHDGADGLVITQDQRTRAGVIAPAITHRVVRQPPAPGEQAAR